MSVQSRLGQSAGVLMVVKPRVWAYQPLSTAVEADNRCLDDTADFSQHSVSSCNVL